jgi:hypothetical protein
MLKWSFRGAGWRPCKVPSSMSSNSCTAYGPMPPQPSPPPALPAPKLFLEAAGACTPPQQREGAHGAGHAGARAARTCWKILLLRRTAPRARLPTISQWQPNPPNATEYPHFPKIAASMFLYTGNILLCTVTQYDI